MSVDPGARSILRGALAALVSIAVVSTYALVREAPGMLSPSEAPNTVGGLAIALPIWFVSFALFYGLWLLPGCAVTRFIASSRGVRGMGAAVAIGGVAAVVASGTIYFFPSLFEWPLTRQQVTGKLSAALMAGAFVLSWFVTYELLRRRAEADRVSGPNATQQLSLPRLALRTTAETLAIVIVVSYSAIVGGIAGGFMDAADGVEKYKIKSVSSSPDGTTRAYTVSDDTPDDYYEQVYVLPATETWTATHRGLLLWQGAYVEVHGVVWTSDNLLRVQVDARDYRKRAQSIYAYSRGGFIVSTETSAGS